jgi:hypothetical protein
MKAHVTVLMNQQGHQNLFGSQLVEQALQMQNKHVPAKGMINVHELSNVI